MNKTEVSFDYDRLSALIFDAEERLCKEKNDHEKAVVEAELSAYKEAQELVEKEKSLRYVQHEITSKALRAERDVAAQSAPCFEQAALVACWKALERVKGLFRQEAAE